MLVAGLLLAGLDLLLLYPAVLGASVLAPEDSLLFNAPLSAVRPASLLHASNYLLTDAVEVFHPDLLWARGLIRAGEVPLWNPLIFDGFPEFASQQTAILFPLTWLAYALPFWQALGLVAALKLLLAGLGTCWLCRRLGLGRAAGLLAGVSYSLGAYFVIWLEHPQTNIYALIPWLLGTIDLVCAGRRLRDGAAFAAVVGLCLLGGHPESVAVAALAAIPFAVLAIARLAARPERLRAVILLASFASLGVAGGAVAVEAFAQLAGQAPQLARGGGEGLPERSLLSLLLPDLWGRPDVAFEAGGPSNYAERTTYVGVLPLMLAAAGLVRMRAVWQRFFLGLLLAGGVLAFHVPTVTEAIRGLPGFALVDFDRVLIVVALALAVLAGYGLESLIGVPEPRPRRARVGAACAVGLLPLTWVVAHSGVLAAFPRFSDLAPSLWGSLHDASEAGAAAATRALLLGLAGIGVVVALTSRRARGPASAAAVGLVCVDLVALMHGYHPAIPQALAAPGPTRSLVAATAAQGTGRTLGFNEYLIPNVGSRYGLREPSGHGLPALGRYLALWNGLGGFGFQTTRLRPKVGTTAKLFDAFGVTVVLTSPHDIEPPDPGLRLVARYPDGKIYRNPAALSRAYVATSWRPAANASAALGLTLASTGAQLHAAPVIEGAPGAGAASAGGTIGGGVRFVDDASTLVSLSVNARRAGYLVLLDSYFPGWVATVDGRRAPILPANEAFRAVAIPAGHHLIVFRYQPTGVYAAALVSGVSWIAILGLLVVPRVVRRRRPPEP